MKIEFTRAEVERIILDHIKSEILPYVTIERPTNNSWGLPDGITVQTDDEDATQ
jgi:hypothetical protein